MTTPTPAPQAPDLPPDPWSKRLARWGVPIAASTVFRQLIGELIERIGQALGWW